jgi:hypothetical protein
MVFVMYGVVLLIVLIAVVVAARKDTRLASTGVDTKSEEETFNGQSDCSLEASHVVDRSALRNHDCRGPCCRDKAALMPCEKTLLAS